MRLPRAIYLVLFIVTVVLYIPVINHDFVNFDDGLYVTSQKLVQQGLTWPGIRWAFTGSHASNWHPVTWLSHMLDCSFFGVNPAGHHLTSVLFHALNTLLLFHLLRRLTGVLWPAALVAALFAWHPLHVESVAWVSERKDVLSTFFGLLAMLAYVTYATNRRWRPYLLAIVWYALSLMAKPMLVTLPFLLLLLDYWPLARLPKPWRPAPNSVDPPKVPVNSPNHVSWGRLLLEKTPFAALSIASCVITLWAQYEGRSLASLEALPFRYRCLNAATAYVSYLGKTFWPTDLAILYPLYLEWTWTQIAGSALILAGITAAALIFIRRRPYFGVGWFWFLGTLVPVIGLVQAGSQSMADRYTYVPLIGVFLAIAWSLGDLLRQRARFATSLTAGVAALLLVCAVLTRLQTRHWQNSNTLFEHTIAVTKHNYAAYGNLGAGLLEIGQAERSIPYLEEALRIKPDHASSHINLGIALAEVGRADEAPAHFTKALALAPNIVQANYFMGVSLASRDRYAEARPYLLRAIELAPDEVYYRHGVAVIMAKQNDLAAAVEQFSEILRRVPDDASALYNLGAVLARQGRFEPAIARLEAALRLNPDLPETLRSLAWILATAEEARFRNGNRAVQYAQKAVELAAEADPYSLDTLAAACAETGRFEDAIKLARQAVDLAEKAGRSKLADEIRRRLLIYQSGRAYRESKT